MTKVLQRPLPRPTPESKPFWDGCRNHQLLIQKCKSCGDLRFPPSLLCPSCSSLETEWVPSSGKGEIWSHAVFHKVYHPAFERNIPYVVAVVELEEGVRMVTNIVGCAPDEVSIGMAVEVFFDDVAPEVTIPRFKPSKTEDAQVKTDEDQGPLPQR